MLSSAPSGTSGLLPGPCVAAPAALCLELPELQRPPHAAPPQAGLPAVSGEPGCHRCLLAPRAPRAPRLPRPGPVHPGPAQEQSAARPAPSRPPRPGRHLPRVAAQSLRRRSGLPARRSGAAWRARGWQPGRAARPRWPGAAARCGWAVGAARQSVWSRCQPPRCPTWSHCGQDRSHPQCQEACTQVAGGGARPRTCPHNKASLCNTESLLQAPPTHLGSEGLCGALISRSAAARAAAGTAACCRAWPCAVSAPRCNQAATSACRARGCLEGELWLQQGKEWHGKLW